MAKMRRTEVVNFARELSILIDVGVSLADALAMLSERISNVPFRRIVTDISQNIRRGDTFSDCLAAYPEVFPGLFINVVKTGEQSGRLKECLDYLAEMMEKQQGQRTRVRAAMIYPAVALAAALVLVLFILVVLVPHFEGVFRDLGGGNKPIPKITAIVWGLSHIVRGWGLPVAVVVLAAIVLALRAFLHTSGGRLAWDRFKLRFPILGEVGRDYVTARFARTMSTLLRSGVSVQESLALTTDTIENRVLEQALEKARADVEAGVAIEEALRENSVIPPLVMDMIAVGEASGSMEAVMTKVADVYEKEVDVALEGLGQIIEPLLIVCVGGLVILIALSVFMPYFQTISSIAGQAG